MPLSALDFFSCTVVYLAIVVSYLNMFRLTAEDTSVHRLIYNNPYKICFLFLANAEDTAKGLPLTLWISAEFTNSGLFSKTYTHSFHHGSLKYVSWYLNLCGVTYKEMTRLAQVRFKPKLAVFNVAIMILQVASFWNFSIALSRCPRDISPWETVIRNTMYKGGH